MVLAEQNSKDLGMSKSSIVDHNENQSKIQIKGANNSTLNNNAPQSNSNNDKKCNC